MTTEIEQQVETLFKQNQPPHEAVLADSLANPHLIKEFARSFAVDMVTGLYGVMIWFLYQRGPAFHEKALSYVALLTALTWVTKNIYHQEKYKKNISTRNSKIKALFVDTVESHSERYIDPFEKEEQELEDALTSPTEQAADRKILQLAHFITSSFLVFSMLEGVVHQEFYSTFLLSILTYLLTKKLLQVNFSQESKQRMKQVSEVFTSIEDSNMAYISSSRIQENIGSSPNLDFILEEKSKRNQQ